MPASLGFSEAEWAALDQYAKDVKEGNPRPHIVDYITLLPRVGATSTPQEREAMAEQFRHLKELAKARM